MPSRNPRRMRFVATCQQLLALAVVVVALLPAARVVSLDVVPGDSAPAPAVHGHHPLRAR